MEFDWGAYPALIQVSLGYSEEEGTFPRVTHPSAAHPEGCARLACVKPAASVRSEPGSNSQVESACALLDSRTSAHRPDPQGPGPKRHRLSCTVPLTGSRWPTNGEADTHIIGFPLVSRHADVRPSNEPNRPHIPSSSQSVQRAPEKRQHIAPDLSATRCPLTDFTAALQPLRGHSLR